MRGAASVRRLSRPVLVGDELAVEQVTQPSHHHRVPGIRQAPLELRGTERAVSQAARTATIDSSASSFSARTPSWSCWLMLPRPCSSQLAIGADRPARAYTSRSSYVNRPGQTAYLARTARLLSDSARTAEIAVRPVYSFPRQRSAGAAWIPSRARPPASACSSTSHSEPSRAASLASRDVESDLLHHQAQVPLRVIVRVRVVQAGAELEAIEIGAGRPRQTGGPDGEERPTRSRRGERRDAHRPGDRRRMALGAHERKPQAMRVDPRGVDVEVERGGPAEQRAPEGAILLDGEVGERSHEKVALDRCEIDCDER